MESINVESMPTMADIERAAIMGRLAACNGNISQVAKSLKIGRTSIYRKLEKYRINKSNLED